MTDIAVISIYHEHIWTLHAADKKMNDLPWGINKYKQCRLTNPDGCMAGVVVDENFIRQCKQPRGVDGSFCVQHRTNRKYTYDSNTGLLSSSWYMNLPPTLQWCMGCETYVSQDSPPRTPVAEPVSEYYDLADCTSYEFTSDDEDS